MEQQIIAPFYNSYTAESGKHYDYPAILKLARGNQKLAQCLVDIADGEHLETTFERLVIEGEITEDGNFIPQEEDEED